MRLLRPYFFLSFILGSRVRGSRLFQDGAVVLILLQQSSGKHRDGWQPACW